MTHEEIWKAVLGEIEISISKAQFNTWFKQTSIQSISNTKAIICVPNGFVKEWLENKFHLLLIQSISKFDPSVREISCQVVQDQTKKDSSQVNAQSITKEDFRVAASPHSSPTYTPTSNSSFFYSHSLNPRYLFETFIVGNNNEFARAACQAVANNLGTLYNPLFIYGPVGLGKTHLLQSIGNHVLKSTPEKKVFYTSTEQFTQELINAIKNREMDRFKEQYQTIDLLIIDDIQFLSGREKTQYEFFNIFNSLYQLNKQIVISSDRAPKAIATLEDRLRSRFEGGMIADINRPDFETRMAILTSKAIQKDFFLPDNVAQFITENITDNVRELEGALNRIIATSELQGDRTITLETTQRILKEIIGSSKKKAITPEEVMQTVCEHFNIPLEDLCKKSRKKEVALPRQIAMYILRKELKTPYATIGRKFGGRDHTTALHAFEKISKELESNSQRKDEIEVLQQKIYSVV